MPVKQGVPRGSIVGPILFVLFINDLPLYVTNSDVDIYADNSTLTFSSRWNANISFMEKNVNEDLDQVVKWSKMNKMVISQTKTKCMFVVGKRLRKRLDNLNSNLNISLNGAIIDQVKSHRLLGIYLDQDLDFDIQAEVLCKSLSKKIGFQAHKSIFKTGHIKCSMMMLSLNILFSMVRVCGHLRARQIWTAFSDFKREQQE